MKADFHNECIFGWELETLEISVILILSSHWLFGYYPGILVSENVKCLKAWFERINDFCFVYQ